MDALKFLEKTNNSSRQPIYALVGEETFLKSRCREKILQQALGDTDPDYAVSQYAGDQLDFSTIRNDLDTIGFLSPCRIIIVEPADDFVTKNRESLERYAAKPSRLSVLILDVKSFPETTRLAKALPDAGKLICKPPSQYKIADWCIAWCRSQHHKRLGHDAAGLLVERVGTAMGLLDQELHKLSTVVGANPEITFQEVDQLVGRSRLANVFQLLDGISSGRASDAFKILHELFEEGEEPIAILGALTSQLRKLAGVGRLLSSGQALGPALDAAGVPKWPQARQNAERQIRHLGLRRLLGLTEQLVKINLGMKGGNALSPQLQLERLIVELAKKT